MRFNENRWEVELHIHLDGAFRPSTVYRYAEKKGIHVPGSNAEEFTSRLAITQPNSLSSFLQTFDYIISPIAGDKEAINQITLDFVEDCVTRGGHCYVEPRFSPHILTGGKLSAEEVTKTVLDALERGGANHDLQWRAILCMMRGNPEWSDDVVAIAKKFQPYGVVAVDVAGDDKPCDGTNTDPRIKEAFKKAKAGGLHCIAHAGENGPAASVTEAVHEMFAERIGHGYHILDDPAVYKDVRERNIHFEASFSPSNVCPLSSKLTGSVHGEWSSHPITRFEADKVNYSISTDDPTVTGQWMQAEKRMLAMQMVLEGEQFHMANLRAAEACFLGAEDKAALVQHLKDHAPF
ncbi:Adenosine deaminase [Echinococcus granulosus]|uniref:Adenosine deaminase n=1 Tax=Echinococcus granulosus TaxID=6210 RepID=A0A068WTP7_ECHGR|nr:Adenosine deaminase [Echinococcus granulosus]CDS21000.1 adenosine deaminase [Echinococcus granulosus]